MRRYRLLEIDWEQLDGLKCRVEVSASNICLELKDGRLLKIAVVMRERVTPQPSQASPAMNGQGPDRTDRQVGDEEVIPRHEGSGDGG
jgi:hypothetical protein